MKGAFVMEAKRWTLGVVLAAAVSLFGLIQADASPFSTHILSDDLGNQVNGKPPKDPATLGYNVNGNDGHGNNEDGVDSSNKGASKEGQDTTCADGTYCDDEINTGSTDSSTTNSGKGNSK
jgi:hypothetical protein